MGWQDTISAIYRDERFILTTIGVVSFAIVTTMIQTLNMIRDDNEVPPIQPKTQYITQETENSLQLDTLEKLLEHPNYAISEIALRILYDRAINDPSTIDVLLRGITRPKYDDRLRCLHTLTLLVRCTGGFNNMSSLDDPKTYTALVRSLEMGLENAEPLDVRTPTWDEFNLRDAAEKMCLTLLAELGFQCGGKGIIKAKFVEKWLAKQDWGKEPAERRKAFQSYMENRRNRIFHIVQKIKMYRRGLRALERAGLIDKELPDTTEAVLMEYTAGSEPLVLRAREHSVEEQRLRRQHREAMVLNDGTRPLGREDIIERDHGVTIE